ncbi:hypothetical protein MRY82_08980 [bacterium]|nr:hypothetical protein [bacterium]
MTGLIWFVQVVHYPLFALIEPSCFPHYAKKHQWLTSFVVGPIMLIEVFSAMWLFIQYHFFLLNLVMLIGIWLSTAIFQIPLHGRLAEHFDRDIIHSLVRGNWIRTFLWTLKSIVLILSFIDFA